MRAIGGDAIFHSPARASRTPRASCVRAARKVGTLLHARKEEERKRGAIFRGNNDLAGIMTLPRAGLSSSAAISLSHRPFRVTLRNVRLDFFPGMRRDRRKSHLRGSSSALDAGNQFAK